MAEDIPIITGDPLKKEDGASFTCFVLPFRYQPFLISSYDATTILGGDKIYYKPINMDSQDWISRKRYFTSETARVLYDHAQWLEVHEDGWETFMWGSKANKTKVFTFYNDQSQHITIKFHAPQLILFEGRITKKTRLTEMSLGKKRNRNLFDIGFLILKASFETSGNQLTYRDMLFFNELFRYWRVPYAKHQEKMRLMLENSFGWRSDDFYLQRWSKLLQIPFQDSDNKQLYSLFSSNWRKDARAWWLSETVTHHAQSLSKHNSALMDNAGWICYADNRAFVWSCAVVKDGANAMKRMGRARKAKPELLGGWIKFLNVDPPGKLDWINKATSFEKEWAKGRCYDRWSHSGTLYGFNYHAGVMLTGPRGEPPIVRHFHDQYQDMTLLLLYLRITLFRFSRELTRLSTEMRRTEKFIKKHRAEFKILRREFAIFTNLYQFPLISNQQQAIEMYALIRKRMDVQELFREIEEEIKSSHEYFQFEEESRLNYLILFLTVIGLFVAGVSVLDSYVNGFLKELLN